MPWQARSFDEILAVILTDRKNLSGGKDVEVLITKLREYAASTGSAPDVSMETLINDACLADAIWGMEKRMESAVRQIFRSTADDEYLDRHGADDGVPRLPGETRADYAARLLYNVQQPPAGGNQYDYPRWAKEVSGVKDAWCFPLAQGEGTVDVVVLADKDLTGDEVASSSARIGKVTSIEAGKCVDSGALFDTGFTVPVGTIIENPFQNKFTIVTAVDNDTHLSLADDIFLFPGETYIVHCQYGLSTSVTANKLVASGGAFATVPYKVQKGDPVYNLDAGTETTVAAVDDGTHLSLVDDIFTESGQRYLVKGLIARVKLHIDDVRPVDDEDVEIFPIAPLVTDVEMTPSGPVNKPKTKSDAEAIMSVMIPKQVLYLDQLRGVATANGAFEAGIADPGANVVPVNYQTIRPGDVVVN